MFRKKSFWMMGGAALVVIGALVMGLGLLGKLPWQRGNVYTDPQGRFSLEVDPDWEKVETDGQYAQFKVQDPPMSMYILVLKAGTAAESYDQALQAVGVDPQSLTEVGVTTFGDWQASSREDAAGFAYGLATQMVGDNAYVMLVKGDAAGVSPENATSLRVMSSMKITGKEAVVIESFPEVEAMAQNEVNRLAGSITAAVVYQGNIVYTYSYGQANPVAGIAANPQTIYAYGSMTKVFTATALMQLVEQGKVDLDAWPGEYIPDFPENWHVTVRQLLTHSACLPDNDRLGDGLIAYKPGETLPTLKDVFANYVKDYPNLICAEPGKASSYANTHFLTLGRIIEAVSGEPYDRYVVEHLLVPLGMDQTRFKFVEPEERYAKDQYPEAQIGDFVAMMNDYRGPGQEDLVLQHGKTFATLDDYQILPPWGGLRGTAGDLTHFLQMQMDGGRYGNTQVLKPETVAAMQTMQLSTDGSPLGFGLGWWVGQDDYGVFYYHHGGGAGFNNSMRIYPKLGLGVVVMSNVIGYNRDGVAAGLASAWMHQK